MFLGSSNSWIHGPPSSPGSDLWCKARHEHVFPWLGVQVVSLRNGSDLPPPFPPKSKAAIGPGRAEKGLVGIRLNGTHIGQVLQAPAQGLP